MTKDPHGQVKTAIVTGACSGIGLALVRHLLAKATDGGGRVEWRVVMADINQAAYARIASTLPAERHLFIRTDVSSWSDQVNLFDRAFDWSNGRVDFFANNAGIAEKLPFLGWLGQAPNMGDSSTSGPNQVMPMPEPPDLSCLNIDLKAAFYGLQLFVHCTRKTRLSARLSGDSSVNGFAPKMTITASMAGIYSFLILPIYTAAKHGCVGLVRAAAPTLFEAEGIALNCIMPSTVITDLIPREVADAWPEDRRTPYETITRAFDELVDVEGHVENDGGSNGIDGQIKIGCCVEAVASNLYYRNPVEFPDETQAWVWAQAKKEGILGKHMLTAFGMKT